MAYLKKKENRSTGKTIVQDRKSCKKWGETEMALTAYKNEQAQRRPGDGDAPNLSKILDVLLACVHDETEAIRKSLAFDLKGSNAVKSRLLYELSRASRGIDAGSLQAGCKEKLLLLKAELRRNAQIAGAHLAALREITGLMIDAARREETDGTYSRQGPNGGYA
jgi:hypothetical protein